MSARASGPIGSTTKPSSRRTAHALPRRSVAAMSCVPRGFLAGLRLLALLVTPPDGDDDRVDQRDARDDLECPLQRPDEICAHARRSGNRHSPQPHVRGAPLPLPGTGLVERSRVVARMTERRFMLIFVGVFFAVGLYGGARSEPLRGLQG